MVIFPQTYWSYYWIYDQNLEQNFRKQMYSTSLEIRSIIGEIGEYLLAHESELTTKMLRMTSY